MNRQPKQLKTPTPKIRYVVEIDGQTFTTYAISDKGAVSNAAYQYAKKENEDVKLVQWKIKNGELKYEVVEGK